MAVSEAQKRATAKYEGKKYDKVLVRFPKDTKKRIEKVNKGSINSYIINSVLNSLNNDENNASQAEISQEKEIQEEFSDRLNKEALEALFKMHGNIIIDPKKQNEFFIKYDANTFRQYIEYLETLTTE